MLWNIKSFNKGSVVFLQYITTHKQLINKQFPYACNHSSKDCKYTLIRREKCTSLCRWVYPKELAVQAEAICLSQQKDFHVLAGHHRSGNMMNHKIG